MAADLCAGGGAGAAATEPSLLPHGWSQALPGSLDTAGDAAVTRGPQTRGHLAVGERRWRGSAGRQRDERIHSLGAAAVRQSSCFAAKSPNSVPGKNKWERSRCLALCRAAARAQPWLFAENTNFGDGLVHRQKQLKNVPLQRNARLRGLGGSQTLLLWGVRQTVKVRKSKVNFPWRGIIPHVPHPCCPPGSPAGPCPCPCRAPGSVAKATSAPTGDGSKAHTWAVLGVQGV